MATLEATSTTTTTTRGALMDEATRTAIPRVVAVVQGKGGVGKTSLTSNVAGLAAKAGFTVLTIDTDPQGNLVRDFGMGLDDGEALYDAIRTGGELPVVTDVRTYANGGHLDVVPGGPAVGDLNALAFTRAASRGVSLSTNLRAALARCAAGYDLILVDGPPGEAPIVEATMEVASAVVIPTRADSGSLDGIGVVARRFVHARHTNPDIRLAGVVMFAISSQGFRLAEGARVKIEGILGGVAPVFDAQVRHSDTAAVDTRNHGLLVHELEEAGVKHKVALFAALRAGDTPPEGFLCGNPGGVAFDYERVAAELMDRLTSIELERGRMVAV
jgi:chromosome partitioning protein